MRFSISALNFLLPLLALIAYSTACSEEISTPCCSSAYISEQTCEEKVYTKYGYNGGRQAERALNKCFNAYSDSCENNKGVVEADLGAFGIV